LDQVKEKQQKEYESKARLNAISRIKYAEIKGKEEGMKKEKITIARKLKSMSIPVEQIKEATGLIEPRPQIFRRWKLTGFHTYLNMLELVFLKNQTLILQSPYLLSPECLLLLLLLLYK